MISIIVAINKNNGIGYKNQLLYWLPNDLKRFKTLTTGHTIIMGRKTFESLPKGALPNRRNIVLSSQDVTFPGAECFHSLNDALEACKDEIEVFIIGGASLYKEAMHIADRLYITEKKRLMLSSLKFHRRYGKKKVENAIQQMKSISTHIVFVITIVSNKFIHHHHSPDLVLASGV